MCGAILRGMVRVVLVAVVVVLAVSPATAGAVDLRFPDGRVAQPYQRWVDEAGFPMPTGVVILKVAACPGTDDAEACAQPVRSQIDTPRIWIKRKRDRLALVHELGHVFDEEYMTEPLRQEFLRITRDDGPWTDANRWEPPSERFAEAFRYCVTDEKRLADSESPYLYRPRPATHRRICRLMRRAASRPESRPGG